MSRQVHVRFCEQRGGKFPPLTLLLDNPKDLWDLIASKRKTEWRRLCNQHSLHRFKDLAYDRLWHISKGMVEHYDGDGRKVISKNSPTLTRLRLEKLGFGDQISRMIVGAFKDHKLLRGKGDVKADVHVRRALGRLVNGQMLSEMEAALLSREIHPRDPWLLDAPLWRLGKDYCHLNEPKCLECPVRELCEHTAYE